MKKSNLILLSLSVLFLLAGCSKEKRIERSLHSRGGEWEIESWKEESKENGVIVYSDTYINAGTMDFSKNGNLVWTLSIDGSVDVFGGSWTNTKDELTLIIDGEGIVFDITDRSRKALSLESIQTYSFGGVQEIYTIQIELAKK